MLTADAIRKAILKTNEEKPMDMYQTLEDEGPRFVFAMGDEYSFDGPSLKRLAENLNAALNEPEKPCSKFNQDAWLEKLSQKYKSIDPKRILSNRRQSERRFKEQIKTEEKAKKLELAIDNYKSYLDQEDWRHPKTTFATFLGTRPSGFFWEQFVDFQGSDKPSTDSIKSEIEDLPW